MQVLYIFCAQDLFLALDIKKIVLKCVYYKPHQIENYKF